MTADDFESDTLWLDTHHEITVSELTQTTGLSTIEVRELVEYGAITPVDVNAAPWRFHGQCLSIARTASRLRDDFDLDSHALALALKFMSRINELEAELRELRAQFPRRLQR